MGRADPATVRAVRSETVLCPYCGVPLFTAKDRADHLELQHCCCGGEGHWDCADVTDPHARCDCGARRAG